MMEIWKDIEGYEGVYMVSNLGRVKSLNYRRTGKERILKPGKNKKGYLYVNLFKDKKGKMHRVHRLVAMAFLPNPDNLTEINHISEIKNDNRVVNLEWCSCKYNNNYGSRNQRIGDKLINGKRSKAVYQYSLDGEFVKEWKSLMEIERSMEFSVGNICKCCNGQRKTAYGYIWRYRQ